MKGFKVFIVYYDYDDNEICRRKDWEVTDFLSFWKDIETIIMLVPCIASVEVFDTYGTRILDREQQNINGVNK